MPEPTIQDIMGIRADPELGTGNAAVVYDSKDLVHTLNQAAQQKAENDWRKYNMFMTNLKEVYKDLDEIAKQPVLTEDRDKLKNTMAEIVKGISSDPRGFFSGGPKYQETLGKLTQLQSETTESKQNNLYDAAHRQYFYANPELDTPENRAAVDAYRKGQLGARAPYMLKLPGIFDPKLLSDQIALAATSELTTDKTLPDGHIERTAKTEVDPAKWDKIVLDVYGSIDKRGNPMMETVKKNYELLPDAAKARFANSADPVFEYFKSSLHAPGSKISTTLSGDPAWEQKQATKRTGMTIAGSLEENKRSIKQQMINQGYVPFDPKNPIEINDPLVKGGKRPALASDAIKDPNFGELYIPGLKLQSTVQLNQANAITKQQKAAALGANSPLATDDYWEDQFIKAKQFEKIKTQYKVLPNFTGDLKIEPKDLSGADIVLWDQVIDGSKNNKINDIQVRFENGEPVGIIVDGTYYNSNQVTGKANERAINLMGKGEQYPYKMK
jgi:hypothetical protein